MYVCVSGCVCVFALKLYDRNNLKNWRGSTQTEIFLFKCGTSIYFIFRYVLVHRQHAIQNVSAVFLIVYKLLYNLKFALVTKSFWQIINKVKLTLFVYNTRLFGLFQLFIVALFVSIFLCKILNNNKKVYGFNNIFSWIFKIFRKSKTFGDTFL